MFYDWLVSSGVPLWVQIGVLITGAIEVICMLITLILQFFRKKDAGLNSAEAVDSMIEEDMAQFRRWGAWLKRNARR